MRLFALLASSALVAGCAPRYLVYTEAGFPVLRLRGEVASVAIIDKRTDLAPIHVAFLNPKGPSVFRSPLDSVDSASVLAQANRNWTGNGISTDLEIEIKRAQAGYRVGFWIADETSEADLIIRASSRGARIGECTGNARLNRRSQKASEKMMKRMFVEALQLAVYECLEALRPQVDAAGGGEGRI